MNAPWETIYRGASLHRILAARLRDVRTMDLSTFGDWLQHQLRRWSTDAVFAQRTGIRDLRSSYLTLRALERRHRQQVAADRAAPHFPRLQQLSTELDNNRKAVAGLRQALQQSSEGRRAQLRTKLAQFLDRQQALRDQLGRLVQSSPERRQLLRTMHQLQQVRLTSGLEQAEAHLADLLRQGGRRSGRTGEGFEQQAATITRRCILPDLIAAEQPGGPPAPETLLLQSVTLAAAGVELDQVILQLPDEADGAVDVLAIVEAKRNINDLARGFKQRQDNLAWLTGDTARYDRRLYRTHQFPSGDFDRAACHAHEGRRLRFTRQSFRRFHRDSASGFFLGRLYFIALDGPIWGLASSAIHRVAYRVATDPRWDPDDEDYLQRIMEWCRGLADPPETPEVLRKFLATPVHANQILLVARRERRDANAG